MTKVSIKIIILKRYLIYLLKQMLMALSFVFLRKPVRQNNRDKEYHPNPESEDITDICFNFSF